ncbi:hypothetical protein D3C78_1433950 [compost metagenome]
MTEIPGPIHIRTFLHIALIQRALLFKAGVVPHPFAQHRRKRLAGMRQMIRRLARQRRGDKPIVITHLRLRRAGLLALHFAFGHQRPDLQFNRFQAVATAQAGVIRLHLIAEQLHAPFARHPGRIEIGLGPSGWPPFGLRVLAQLPIGASLVLQVRVIEISRCLIKAPFPQQATTQQIAQARSHR